MLSSRRIRDLRGTASFADATMEPSKLPLQNRPPALPTTKSQSRRSRSQRDVKNEDRSDYVYENKRRQTKCRPHFAVFSRFLALSSGFLPFLDRTSTGNARSRSENRATCEVSERLPVVGKNWPSATTGRALILRVLWAEVRNSVGAIKVPFRFFAQTTGSMTVLQFEIRTTMGLCFCECLTSACQK
jgi:hypothetical protein